MTPETLLNALNNRSPILSWSVKPLTLFWQIHAEVEIGQVVYSGTMNIDASRFVDEPGQKAAIEYILYEIGRQIGRNVARNERTR